MHNLVHVSDIKAELVGRQMNTLRNKREDVRAWAGVKYMGLTFLFFLGSIINIGILQFGSETQERDRGSVPIFRICST